MLANVGTGEVVRQFQGDAARRVNGIAFNPDGTLALSGFGNQLVLWDVEKGTSIRRLAAHNDLVSEIQFSADGRYAMSKSRDNNVRVWDITSGDSAQLMSLRVPVDIPDRAFPHIPGFHPSRNAAFAGVFAWRPTMLCHTYLRAVLLPNWVGDSASSALSNSEASLTASVIRSGPCIANSPRAVVQRFGQLLKDAQARGVAICLIEHNLDVVVELSNRIAFLDQGKVLAEGDPETILRDPALAAIYFGDRPQEAA